MRSQNSTTGPRSGGQSEGFRSFSSSSKEMNKDKGKGLMVSSSMEVSDDITSPPTHASTRETAAAGSAGAAGGVGKDATTVASSGKGSKPPHHSSICWEIFDIVLVDDEKYAECMCCGKKYKYNSNRCGTSTLVGHYKICPKNPKRFDPSQQQLAFQPAECGADGQLVSWHFDQQVGRDAVVKMILVDELPFSFIQHKGFRDLMKAVCPMFVVPSRFTIRKDICHLYETEKLKLHEFFRKSTTRISFTTDTWTSVQQINYMCLTTHFIDNNWVLHKKIINFCPIDSHKGEDIGRAIVFCLNAWGLDRIMAVTVDNASANDGAIRHLGSQRNLLCNSVLDGRFMHMRCVAHILNLIVNDRIGLIGKSVERIRYAVRFIKLSPMRLTRFKLAVVQAGYRTARLLSLDVSTRWNSTYMMLRSACRLQKAFDIYCRLDPTLNLEMDSKVGKDKTQLGRLSDMDWVECNSVMSFLGQFYEITVRISGSKYATSNLILYEISDIHTFISVGLGHENIDMRNMAAKMSIKYHKYFGDLGMLNLFTFIAPIFDPRKKLGYVNYLIQTMFVTENSNILVPLVKQSLESLFFQYSNEYDQSDESVTQSATPAVAVTDKSAKHQRFEAYKRLKTSIEGAPKSELEKYLLESELEDSTDFQVLTWWSANANRYPILSTMARDVLAIPITTVSSECDFSDGCRILPEFTSSLSTEIVQALICTKDWLKCPPTLLSITDLEIEMDKLQIVDDGIAERSSCIGIPAMF